jgi:hypothetical protein
VGVSGRAARTAQRGNTEGQGCSRSRRGQRPADATAAPAAAAGAAAAVQPAARGNDAAPSKKGQQGVRRVPLRPYLAFGREGPADQVLQDLGDTQQPLAFHARLLANAYMEWVFW